MSTHTDTDTARGTVRTVPSAPTPGPWRLRENNRLVVGNSDKLDTPIAVVDMTSIVAEEAQANARLIAAAPDLLAALKEVASMIEAYHEVPPTRANMVRAAIARAEGRAVIHWRQLTPNAPKYVSGQRPIKPTT